VSSNIGGIRVCTSDNENPSDDLFTPATLRPPPKCTASSSNHTSFYADTALSSSKDNTVSFSSGSATSAYDNVASLSSDNNASFFFPDTASSTSASSSSQVLPLLISLRAGNVVAGTCGQHTTVPQHDSIFRAPHVFFVFHVIYRG
jgi:hypothetical protein